MAGRPALDERRSDRIAWALLLSVAAVLARVYFLDIDLVAYGPRVELHRAILDGSAPSPYQYRVLVPFVVDALRRALMPLLAYREAFLTAFGAYDYGALCLLLVGLYRYLRRWFTTERALIGTLFVAATMPIALRDHHYQPWSLLEPGLMALALTAILDGRRWQVVALTAVASLNRETGVFIPALYFLGSSVSRADGARRESGRVRTGVFALCVAVWAAAFVGLRLGVGTAPPLRAIGQTLQKNVDNRLLLTALWNIVVFLGVFWVAAARGLRSAPAFLRRVALVIPAYLVVVAIWGIWREVRLLMPLYPVVVPLALWRLRLGGEIRPTGAV